MSSLVVCSNTSNESVTTAGTNNSIFKPFNFRNDLSSTMMLPANCQVALQSCKYNVDGRIALSDRATFYQYFGEDVKDTDTNLDKSTAVPVRSEINSGKQVEEYTADELALAIEEAFNEYAYHPNKRKQFDCTTAYDGSTHEFKGFKISAGLFTSTESTIPADDLAEYWGDQADKDEDYWSYESGVFTTKQLSTEDEGYYLPVIFLKDKPISLYDGSFTVDFDNANEAGMEWGVGLSRYAQSIEEVFPAPTYYTDEATVDLGQWREPYFCDYVVHRDGVNLRLSCCTGDPSAVGGLIMRNINYTDNPSSHFFEGSIYNINENANGYTKVKYSLRGEIVDIVLIDGDENEFTLITYDDSVGDKRHNLPPICQPKWQLHPVLHIESDNTTFGQSLTIEHYVPCADLTDFDITTDSWNFSSSFDYIEQLGFEIETRPWNDYSYSTDGLTPYADIAKDANPVIELSDIIITKPDTVYVPSHSANTEDILGFKNRSPMKFFTFADEETVVRDFTSISVPTMLSPKSLFVRLGGMTQYVMNAHNGNRSSIIAHLPKRDESGVEIGSLFYEPRERVYIDLNNPSPMPINTFDLSISYVNEQLATIVSGQTIVCLLFRADPTK